MPIEYLRPGDLVTTRDNGPQPLIWIAARKLSATELSQNDALLPVVIAPELIGADAPLRVSQQHGMLLRHDGDERLIRAKHLARLEGGKARIARGTRSVTYIHLMFDAHQIVFANKAPSESFYPGEQAIGALSVQARQELATLFPDLPHFTAKDHYGSTVRDFARFGALPDHLSDLTPVNLNTVVDRYRSTA